MASGQLRRENVTDERKIEVEKDRVPKMTTHFESLATKGDEDVVPLSGEKVHVQTVPVKVMGVEVGQRAESGTKTRTETEHKAGEIGHGRVETGHRSGEQRKGPSLEEITKSRASAQQNSMEAIRAAEERYHKAKQSTEQHKDTPSPFLEKGMQAKDYTTQKAVEAKDVISSKTAALKGTVMEKAPQTKDFTAQKAVEAKDVISSKTTALKDTVMEKAPQAKDYTAQKAVEAKDVISSKGQTAAQYAAEKAKAVKDTAVDTTITAAGYGGKVASGVKDQAVVAGWGATHYTLEKVTEATKAMANVTSSVAGYTGEKAVAAGQTVAWYAADTLAATKDAVVASEEKAAEFAARKREEAKRELEAKKQSQEKVGGGQKTFTTKEEEETRPSTDITKEQMQMQKPSEKIQESFQGGTEYEQQGQESGGGVFQAIGETIVEIGQTTKDLLVGQSPVVEGMEQKHESRGTIDEKFRGTGCEGI